MPRIKKIESNVEIKDSDKEKDKKVKVVDALDGLLDDIEVDLGLSQVDVKSNRFMTSTGLLSLDLMLSGGMVTGGWYTFFGGEQSSKCLVGESLVLTDRGLLRLDEIYEMSTMENRHGFNDLEVPIYVYSHDLTKRIADKVFRGEGKTIRIETSFGDIIEGLPEHRLWTINKYGDFEWVSLRDLEKGYLLPKEVGQEIYPCSSSTLEEVITISDLTNIQINSENAYLFGRYYSFGKNNSSFLQLKELNTLVKDYPQLKKFGHAHLDTYSLLSSIRKSSKTIQLFYLQGLFERFSSVTDIITLTLPIYDILPQVKYMLENLGVLSFVKSEKTLVIHPDSNKLLLSQLEIDSNFTTNLNTANIIPDIMPGLEMAIELIQTLDKDHKFNLSNLLVKKWLTKSDYKEILDFMENLNIEEDSIPSKCLSYLNRLNTLHGYTWASIIKKEKTKEKKVVYDLSVPETHSYLVNGTISHNSTLVMNQMARAINTPIPYIIYADYEGCVTKDTKIRINGEYIEIEKLIPGDILENPPKDKAYILVEDLRVDTIGDLVDANLYYGGYQKITKIETEDGNTLKGSNHPVLVLTEDGGAIWKNIEEVKVGDRVLTD